jgi:hypothetical protein
MTAKIAYLTAGTLVAICATIVATYQVTLNTAVAQCSAPVSVEPDVGMRGFLDGAQAPMQGGKRY